MKSNNIPIYLNPILAMVCQAFILLTIVLFIFDKSNGNDGALLENEAGAQIAYFLTFQAVSILLMNIEKIIDKTNGIDSTTRKRKILVLSFVALVMIIVPVIILGRRFDIFPYFISMFQFGENFNFISIQSGVLVFIFFNLILLIINPFQTAQKFHTRFVNSFTIGKLALVILVLIIPVLLIWGGDMSEINIDLSVCILLFLNLTLFLTELILYFQIKEIIKNPDTKF